MTRRTALPLAAIVFVAGGGAGYALADDNPEPRVVSVIPQEPIDGIPQEPIRVYDLDGMNPKEFFKTLHGTERAYDTFTVTFEEK